jgi:hypothetical protein
MMPVLACEQMSKSDGRQQYSRLQAEKAEAAKRENHRRKPAAQAAQR